MELQSLIYLFVGVSFTIYFGLALWTKASSTKDFYVANKSFNPVFNGASIAVDFISAATFISLCGAFLSFGYDSFAYIIGITSGFVLLTILIVPYLRKMECLSIPLFFEKRFNSKLTQDNYNNNCCFGLIYIYFSPTKRCRNNIFKNFPT